MGGDVTRRLPVALGPALANRVLAGERPIAVGRLDDLNAVTFQVMRYDQVKQIVEYRHIFLSADGIKVIPTTHRVVYISELDLMAKLGGLELAARHSDWAGGQFSTLGWQQISVYVKAD